MMAMEDGGGDSIGEALGGLSELGGGGKVEICDFVDHMESGGEGNWIENDSVNEFVASRQ